LGSHAPDRSSTGKRCRSCELELIVSHTLLKRGELPLSPPKKCVTDRSCTRSPSEP
jgi:hypothetical protein